MSHDRSPRPVRSFLTKLFGVSRNRSRQPSLSRPPSRNDNVDNPTVGAICPAVSQQSSGTAIVSAPGTRQSDYLSAPPPFSSPSPSSSSRELLDEVAIAGIDPAPNRRQIPPPGILVQKTSPTQGPSPPQVTGQGLFQQAHGFVINDSVFVDNSSVLVNNGSDDFMASLLKETIPGAEFDSSDPNMSLRCHPGTRTEIIKRCQDFILSRAGRPKLRWVVGAAGVGKSAIMQSVAWDEDKILKDIIVGATIFFSINGRQDGTKTINTITYQLAVKLNPYRLFVRREITHDPALLRKSLSVQFKKFIIEPFIHQRVLDPSSRLLIIIDGLDECANHLTQRELLGLISEFCITYPTSPIVWMIASRPEPHISSFFYQPELALSYEKEEIWIDSDDALEDVRYYLRDKFKEIQMASITLRRLPQWPSEDDFSKIAEASGGLFAYASTVVRYISDLTYGDPVSQLDDVLKVIETGAKADVSGDGHPMAQLDALYARILSRIPTKVMANTRKLLLLHNRTVDFELGSFLHACNFLGMTENTAYGATHHIHSIAYLPGPDEAANDRFSVLHKSFYDYLEDSKRSGFSRDFESETEQLGENCAVRILEQAPDGVYMDGASDGDLCYSGGVWRNGPGTGNNISISWPAIGEDNNCKLRLNMFRAAVNLAMDRLEACCSPPCLRALTTCFTELPYNKGYIHDLPFAVFDESRRRELLDHGILKQVPLGTLNLTHTRFELLLRLHFRGHTDGLSDLWSASCHYEREAKWEDGSEDWSTNIPRWGKCHHCEERFVQQFKMRLLEGDIVTIYNVDLTTCAAELRFVDPDDGVSKWTYHFLAKYKVGDKESEASGDELELEVSGDEESETSD